ncbi:glycosyltransferase family 9 protein [Thermomicrobium sp. 4228-Ro]|uniref:glycosyltransferase family 9 protein n=1 Tax=Thermomicrobium sp. 4228-Ro TaxID=2993937 RepID=UPI00224951C5|nr:glycosyltransferase family 9 protein [Thermomicrobium sp. 4228-Ro]MCX2726227.1 glycosyltransferase family 9 protein [Thermomicrobium sp. 4228-Ro]
MLTRFHRILVVKIADLGDTVLILPAIRALRRAFPEARIDLLTSPVGAELAALCPDIDGIHVVDKAKLREARGFLTLGRTCWTLTRAGYDAVVLLHHLTTRAGWWLYRLLLAATRSPVTVGLDNGTGGFFTHPIPDRGFGASSEWQYALQAVEALGATGQVSGPYLVIPEAARRAASRLLASVPRPYVVIHPGVGPFAPARLWPPDHFGTVARQLADAGFGIVVTGTAHETDLARPIQRVARALDLAGRTSLPVLAAVLADAALVIGSDCGVVHLAAALDRPTLALFGPTNVEAWRPLGSTIVTPDGTPPSGTRIVALTRQLPCSPCCYVGYRIGRPHGCRVRSCLRQLQPEPVARLALALVGNAPSPTSDSGIPSAR